MELFAAVLTGFGQIWTSLLQRSHHDFTHCGLRVLHRRLKNGVAVVVFAFYSMGTISRHSFMVYKHLNSHFIQYNLPFSIDIEEEHMVKSVLRHRKNENTETLKKYVFV